MKKLFTLFLFFINLHAQAQLINTFAGNGVPAYGGDGGFATAASMSRPIFCFKDAAGNLLVADYNNSRIRKVTPAGIITTICGTGTPGFSGDGGPATAAEIQNPTGVTVDGAGNIYFCDFNNQCIRKINTSGIISTIAGTPGVSGYTGDGGPATAATFWFPGALALDVAGNIYISDEWNNRIRKVNTAGIISTFAGDGPVGFLSGGYGGDGGLAINAHINFPVGIAADAAGNIIFCDDQNFRIRKISTAGIINTIAGDGIAGSLGDGGPATSAELNSPEGLAIDQSGDIFTCEQTGSRVREVNSAGVISTIAGTGTAGYSGDGGAATLAEINAPEGLYVDTNTSCVYICDAGNNRVRIVGTCSSTVVLPCNSISMPDSLHLCSGDTATLPAVITGSDSVSSIAWTPATGLSSTTVLTPLLTATASGWYYLTIQSLVPVCSATDSVYVQVLPSDTSFSHTDTTVCFLANPITLYAPAGYPDYNWSTGAATSSVTVTVSGTGTYWVQGTNTCTLLTDTFHIGAIMPDPGIVVIDTALCTGGSVMLYAPSGYTAYAWNTGDTASSDAVYAAGTYWVINTNISACTIQTDTFHVTAKPLPFISLGADTAVCAGDSVVLSSPGSSGSYLWSTGSTAATIEATPGIYVLTVTNNGCVAADTVTVGIQVSPAPFSLGPDTTLCKGDVYHLSTGGVQAVWSTGATGTEISITDSGTYWASITNACGIVADSVDVSFELCDIFFPSAFSPNNDGLNDYAKAVGNLGLFRNYTLGIYNRWGQRIFYTTDIYAGWDGKYNGVTQEIDTYFYMITYTLEGKGGMLKGDLTLIR